MKVLVIGSGGREHALAWKLAQSKLLSRLFCAPGNPGTAGLADNVDISVDSIPELLKFAKAESIDLTVVVVAIITLFLLMQSTGRVNWHELFKKPAIPAADLDNSPPPPAY